jgi:hypothetical protein
MVHGILMNNNFSRVHAHTINVDHATKAINKEDTRLPARHVLHTGKKRTETVGTRVIRSQGDAIITAHVGITPGVKTPQPQSVNPDGISTNTNNSSAMNATIRKIIITAKHLSAFKATTNGLPMMLLPSNKRMGSKKSQRVNKIGHTKGLPIHKGSDKILSNQKKNTLLICPMDVS